MEIEIGRGKKGRRAYGFDDVAIVPSRRTRDTDDIDITWTLGPYRFELPLVASAMDGVVSPDTAVLVPLSSVEPEELRWLWEGRLRRGKLVTIYGDPSVGKSTLAVDIAAHIARAQKIQTGPIAVTAKVSLGPVGQRFGLAVTLEVAIPELPRDKAEALMRQAHEVCPYSNATRGNIEVELRLAGQ